MDDYKEYLAEQVLSEENIVRLLLFMQLPHTKPLLKMLTFVDHVSDFKSVIEGQCQCCQTVSPSVEYGFGLLLTHSRMLYDFHAWQNDKHSGAVHATYMVYGIKKATQANGHSQQDGDVEMTSSASDGEEEHLEDSSITTLSVVAEEDLRGTSFRLHTFNVT